MKKILITDDDVYIGNLLEDVLTKEHYAVLRAYSGTEAVLLLRDNRPDLVLLDLMLPGLTGEEVLKKCSGIPVIVVSAKVGVDDKVALLTDGAVDYITKPFDLSELLARIAVQLRRIDMPENKILEFDGLSLDTSTREVTACEKRVKLTKTEYAILKLLLRNPKQVVTKSQILDLISADTPDCMESSLKVHISNLRKKLRDACGKDYIEAVWGIGFKLHEE
ncbi:MAG: response regulator transcription factor [Oscillospiraceae bacterium]|nr:response regulator transcription factor [Oscillospiraceae bacterium]